MLKRLRRLTAAELGVGRLARNLYMSDHGLRRRVAALAAHLYAGQLTYAEFLEQLPDLELPEDHPISELLDLIEHEPSSGRLLGLAPREHDRYVADIHRRIAELSS